MKYSLTLLLVSVATLQFAYSIGEAFQAEVTRAVAKCKQSLQLSNEAIKTMLSKSEFETYDEKCLGGCILEHIGIIKGNTYDWEVHADAMSFPLQRDFISACQGKVNEDRCELAHEIFSCLDEQENKFKLETEDYQDGAFSEAELKKLM